jgi:hypothetical protein
MEFLFDAAIRFRATVPGINLTEIIPGWSEQTVTDAMVRVAQSKFDECIQIAARDVRFVCFICDAGTVVNGKVIHGAFTNPIHIDDIITLPPFENVHWDAACYQTFFRETFTTYSGEDAQASLEICGVVCDNLPAQVVGLRNFLAEDHGRWAGIMHIPCCNHMINLVFVQALKQGFFREVVSSLPGVIQAMNSEYALQVTRKQCPKIIRTRWVYLVDILGFLINHYFEVHEVLQLIDPADILRVYRPAYLLLLPLSLFSRAMETRKRILAHVIPAAREVLREWAELFQVFNDKQAIVDCLDVLTAHFLARLRRNSFDKILTALGVSPRGRAEIRTREQGFQTHGEIVPCTTPKFIAKMQSEFRFALHPLPNGQLREGSGDPSAVSQGPADFNVIAAMGDAHPAGPTDFVDVDDLVQTEPPPEPEDDPNEPSFLTLLGEEQHISLFDRLGRDLIEGIIPVALREVVRQGTHIGYAADEIRSALIEWWMADRPIPPNTRPDSYWRQIHGEGGTIARLAHVALRFITLVCSEADIERLLCKQKYIQGHSGSNYRLSTIHARLVLHESR